MTQSFHTIGIPLPWRLGAETNDESSFRLDVFQFRERPARRDASGLDYSTLDVLLDGDPPSSSVVTTTDVVENGAVIGIKFRLVFESGDLLTGQHEITVSVSDYAGNALDGDPGTPGAQPVVIPFEYVAKPNE